ncbi:MAG: transaldolase [Candidatus Latescibacteria bacterium]|nr:transaldolase [Candidatus Latescibacterota bacterium]
MKLFLDTASLQEIKEAISWGIIDGVTTNPSLIKKAVIALREVDEQEDIESYIKKILATAGRMCPVSLEVAGLTADEMTEQGILLYEKFDQVAGNVVIKIPVCTINSKGEGGIFDGITAIKNLTEERIPVNSTLIFTPEQALIAAKAGAEYVSPFAGRIDDRIRRQAEMSFEKNDYFPATGIYDEDNNFLTDFGLVSGVDLVSQIAKIFQQYKMECEIIAASIRNPIQAREMAAVGAHISTVPFSVLKAMAQHPGTVDGIDAFTGDLVKEYLGLFSSGV